MLRTDRKMRADITGKSSRMYRWNGVSDELEALNDQEQRVVLYTHMWTCVCVCMNRAIGCLASVCAINSRSI